MLSSVIALNRFGLGARPGDQPPADPKHWLFQQFDRFEPRPQALAQVPTRTAVAAQLADYIEEQRNFAQGKRRLQQPAAMTNAAIPQPDEKPVDPVKRNLRQNIRQNYLVMSSARLEFRAGD